MRNRKYWNTWRTLLVTLCMLFLGCVFLGYSLLGRKVEAFSSVPNSTTIEKPIYDFDKFCYDSTQLERLAQVLLSDNTKKYSDLLNYARNTAGTGGVPVANKQITLQYGRYRFTPESIYHSLVWTPVYISRSNSGDAILTLYLAATSNGMATSQNESAQFSNAGTYSTDYSCTAPSNMYDMSHMRAMSLGNGGDYAFYASDHSNSYTRYTAKSITEASCNKFTDFIEGNDFTGTLYDDIVEPRNIAWQEHESYVTYVDDTSYCWPGEAYGTVPAGHNYYYPNYFDYNAQSKVNYNIWQNDKVWLPSLTEVGNGDLDPENVEASTVNGIWELTKAQRSNVKKSWLRTAATNVPKDGRQYSTYTMFCTAPDGTITTGDVNENLAIRPAIHLNLSKIADKTIAPINLPKAVNAVYNGKVLQLDDVSEEQLTWYNENEMTVNYFLDEKCTRRVAAIDAGTYYLQVQLRNTDNYFLGEDKLTRRKVTKFIVDKIKLKVEWTYNLDQTPQKVEIVDKDNVILQRDKDGDRVPKLGMKYSNVTGAGIQNSPEFPDKMGTYTASAYIIDEDIKNYNYELSGDGLTTHQFLVKERNVPEPYFLADDADYGTDSDGTINKSILNLSYRGKQYVQIANISQYVSVKVSALNSALLDSVEDLGVNADGVQTFIVEEVNNYYFNITLKDDLNTQWESSTEDFKNTNPIRLVLNLTEALITVSFDGLLNSWESARSLEVGLTIHGVYEDISNGGLEMRVYYNDPRGIMSDDLVRNSNGKYVIPAGLNPGTTYYLVAVIAGGSKKDNYIMDGPKTQRFEIVATKGEFDDEDAKWTYLVDGNVPGNLAPEYEWNEHSTQNRALQLPYLEGGSYQFMLTMDEYSLKSHYVRAIYSGDLIVSDAGLHCVTVTITGYDKNVLFEDKTYQFWFNIDKKKYDLSGLEWDYEQAFGYNGEVHSVTLDSEQLNQLPGLTARYITDGEGKNAGTYTTVVQFIVSDEYAKNYIIPNESDPESFINDGSFSFSIEWEIKPKTIIIKWTEKTSSSDIFFIPTLQIGHGLVDYRYQHKEGENWVDCDNVGAETVPETYRVTAVLKAENSGNYKLEAEVAGGEYCEFTVESGKQPVTIGFRINGQSANENQQFVYTGSEFKVVPELNGKLLETGEFDIEFFRDGATAPLSAAPVNVGKYRAVAKNIKLDGAYTVGDTEIVFEIIKADYDTSKLKWKYTHGKSVDYVSWDAKDKKWIDHEGKEFVFSAEYDGTDHTLELIGYEEIGLELDGPIAGNRYTDATENKYTVQVYFVSDPNFNEVNFPKTLDWKITKAKIDFNEVRWGYYDEAGEHEFDFENDVFRVRREDGEFIKYEVRLINLPKAISDLIVYNTQCLTLVNAKFERGNKYSAVGVYETKFDPLNISYPGDKNHEPFSGDDMPTTIPTFRRWEIKERELSKPTYNGGWAKFDNKVHNLIKLSGISEEDLNYLEVDITYIDNNNNIINHFKSYEENAELYTALNAGTYIVRFFEVIEEMSLDNDYNIIYETKTPFWGQVEIVVEQEALVVTWDNNGSIPVARVKGVYVSNMLGTKYTNESGGEVTDAYIRTTDGMQFFAEPVINPSYAGNLKFVMADGEVEKISFFSSLYHKGDNSRALNYPAMRISSQEYTGKPIVFEIADWRSTYERYLYISDGSLTQTEVGKYSVSVSFLKDADAYWAGTESSRLDYTLTFSIIEPQTIAIDYPMFDKLSATWEGVPVTFTITNWILLQNYIEFDLDEGLTVKDGVITATTTGIFDITFRFKEGSKGYWKELEDLGELDEKQRPHRIQLEVTDPSLPDNQILKPRLESTTANWTGSAITFRLANSDYYDKYLELTSGSLTNTNPGTYKVTFRIKVDGYTFNDGTTTIELSYIIVSKNPDDEVLLKKPVLTFYEAQYTGKAITFEIIDWNTLYGTYLDISEGSLVKTEIGEYKIVLSFKEGTKAKWEDETRSDYEITFKITAEPVKEREIIDIPVMEMIEQEFTGSMLTFKIKDWDELSKYLRIDPRYGDAYLIKTDAGVYEFYVQIKDKTACVWSDGTVEDKMLRFSIKRAVITVDEIGSSGDGKLDITNGSQNKMDLDDYFEYVYKDKDGNIVSKDDLKKGEEYTYTVVLKEDKRDAFFNNVEDAENVLKQLEAKSFTFIYQPSEGINPLLIITISVVGVLVFLVVATIIVLAVKRRQYVDEYVDDYGYYNDYDDYEEDDE